MIQSDPENEFPTPLLKFILERQAWEVCNELPMDERLKQRIEMIKLYKAPVTAQPEATQIQQNIL